MKKFSVKGNIRKKVDGGLLTEERDSSGSDSEGKPLLSSFFLYFAQTSILFLLLCTSEDSRRPKNDVSGIKGEYTSL